MTVGPEDVDPSLVEQARRARLAGEARPLVEAAVRTFRDRAAERCYSLLLAVDPKLASRVAREIRNLSLAEGP